MVKSSCRFAWRGVYEGLTKMSKGGPVWTGKVSLHPELLDWPLRRKKPLRIFVNSMSDLFHEDVPDDFIRAVWCTMFDTPQHTYQILTKRPRRMLEYLLPRLSICGIIAKPLDNVWLGVSVEDQARADERIPLLLQTPAAVRWISAEPLLGEVKLRTEWLKCPGGVEYGRGFNQTAVHAGCCEKHSRLQWVVAGGESGPGARPLQLDWMRSFRDQCHAARTPFFLKQLGRWPIATKDEGYPWAQLHDDVGVPIGEWGLDGKSRKGGDPTEWPQDLRIREYP